MKKKKKKEVPSDTHLAPMYQYTRDGLNIKSLSISP